jgi:hypothetical protein
VNSEELEVSLRTEFESYLKNLSAEMRQEISQLQEKIEAEMENHRAQLSGIFKEAADRAESERELDEGFRDSVVEHLRLAKDEGARITATAIAEAEELEKQKAPKVGIKELHEAVNEISSKQSQAEILKTLVHHAGQFTPRGAFFIVKNEHFVGWRTFGSEKGESDEAVRDVFMPFTSDSLLGEAYRSLATVETGARTFSEDAGILEKLGFEGSPDKMYAIPLVVRSRAVAVLYADYGTQGAEVNIEGLETLVRVAGLTVELLASAKGASAREAKRKPVKAFAGEGFAPAEVKESAQPEFAISPGYNAPVNETPYASSFEGESFAAQPVYSQEEPAQEYSAFDSYQPEPAQEETYSQPVYPQEEAAPSAEEKYPSYEGYSWNQSTTETVGEVSADSYSAEANADNYAQDFSHQQPAEASYQPAVEPEVQAGDDFSASAANEYQFDTSQSFEAPQSESYESSAQQPTESSTPPNQESFGAYQPEAPKAETSGSPPAESVAPPVRSRFSERNVDLPIEVSEDERRLHNDARRFARLLVSEIKLYNEQKVKEGRDAGDLYDRLREAIDRSREMYDKRVQPPVAAKFDYFNYELVNTLAEGDESRLGTDYPGASA